MQDPQGSAEVMSVKDWMLNLFLLMLPVINIILLFVWAFGDGNLNRQNYAKASLLWMAIMLGLYLLIAVLLVAVAAASG